MKEFSFLQPKQSLLQIFRNNIKSFWFYCLTKFFSNKTISLYLNKKNLFISHTIKNMNKLLQKLTFTYSSKCFLDFIHGNILIHPLDPSPFDMGKIISINIHIHKKIFDKLNMYILLCDLHIFHNTNGLNELYNLNNVCLKIKHPIHEIDLEYNKYCEIEHDIKKNWERPFSNCLPTIFGQSTIFQKNGTVWGGILMEYFDTSLVHMLYKDYHPTNIQVYNDLNLYFKENLYNVCKVYKGDIDTSGNGLPLIIQNTSTLENALINTLFIILKVMHDSGWIHGDTHLGNFLINSKTKKIALIDFERSHKTNDPRLMLADLQELFGHCSGITLSDPYDASWDMCEIQGVANLLHPFFSTKAILSKNNSDCVDHTLYSVQIKPKPKQVLIPFFQQNFFKPEQMLIFSLLPVCTCFVNETFDQKNKGCIYCKSSFNECTGNFMRSGKNYSLVLNTINEVEWPQIRSIISNARFYIRIQQNMTIKIISENDDLKYWLRSNVSIDEFSDVYKTNKPPGLSYFLMQRVLYLHAFVPSKRSFMQRLKKFLNHNKKATLFGKIYKSLQRENLNLMDCY